MNIQDIFAQLMLSFVVLVLLVFLNLQISYESEERTLFRLNQHHYRSGLTFEVNQSQC